MANGDGIGSMGATVASRAVCLSCSGCTLFKKYNINGSRDLGLAFFGMVRHLVAVCHTN